MMFCRDKPDIDRVSLRTTKQSLLWCPFADIMSEEMVSRGKYAYGYPQGALIHFTAGRSKKGLSNAQGTMNYGLKMGYSYICISSEGEPLQATPLNDWGRHAGKSSHPELGESLSKCLIGIEVCCAGKLTEHKGRFVSWFGDEYSGNEVNIYTEQEKNISPGIYHSFTEDQIATLINLLIWLKSNNPDVFLLKNILGHDEISPGRKTDPGGSLGMTMSDFRDVMYREYRKYCFE